MNGQRRERHPAAPDEAAILSRIAFAGKRHWGYPDAWLEVWRPHLTFTAEYIAAHNVCCAEDGDGQVVGFYALERVDGGFRLENLWLEPAAIGGGLGRRLFEHAVHSARQMNATELLLEADPNAEGFYLHVGARRIGETRSQVCGTERVVPLLRYDLAAADNVGTSEPR